MPQCVAPVLKKVAQWGWGGGGTLDITWFFLPQKTVSKLAYGVGISLYTLNDF